MKSTDSKTSALKPKKLKSGIYLFIAMIVTTLAFNTACRSEKQETLETSEAVKNTNKTDTQKVAVKSEKKKSEYAPVDVEMEAKQLSEHSWYVKGAAGIATDNKGFISNAGFVVTNAGVVVFDALGTPSLAWKLVEEIRKVTDQPIVKVVVSHYHADHIYGLQVFKNLGAEIIAPEGVYEYIDSDAAPERLEERRFSLDPWVNDKTEIIKPDQILDIGEKFTIGNINFQINVIGPAHSDGDLTLYVENDRVLFSGDIIFEGRIPFIGNRNTKRWLETLQKMETNQLHALVPGHGPAAKEPAKALTLTREYLAFLREKMGAAVEEMQDFDEAYKEIGWSKYQSLPAFEAANRRNAFQVYLSMEDEGN